MKIIGILRAIGVVIQSLSAKGKRIVVTSANRGRMVISKDRGRIVTCVPRERITKIIKRG
jgi:hypothetical protein